MVPEEWGAGVWVGTDAVEEVGGVLIQAVVDNDCFVLGKSVCFEMRGERVPKVLNIWWD